MAWPKVLAERARIEEHEASFQAHTADMADERGFGQDHEDTRIELRKGTDASRRMHVPYNRPRNTRGKRMCGATVGWYGALQSVVVEEGCIYGYGLYDIIVPVS